MIYAKCVDEHYITNNVDEFKERQANGEHVYCIGQTTKACYGVLYCVPLNFIFDCLKYGKYIAIIDIENNDANYPHKSSYLGLHITSSEQHVINILNPCEEKTIDFIFDEVGNADLVHTGHLYLLPEHIQEYVKLKKNFYNHNI